MVLAQTKSELQHELEVSLEGISMLNELLYDSMVAQHESAQKAFNCALSLLM